MAGINFSNAVIMFDAVLVLAWKLIGNTVMIDLIIICGIEASRYSYTKEQLLACTGFVSIVYALAFLEGAVLVNATVHMVYTYSYYILLITQYYSLLLP